MAKPWEVQEQLKAQILTWEPLAEGAFGVWWPGFQDVTFKEFPYSESWPACHINILEAQDEPGRPGFPLNGRRLQVGVYVTLQEGELEATNDRLWRVVDAVRDAITSDRTLGGLVNEKVLLRAVRQVPSPMGTPYIGTRRIEFEAVIVESMI